MSDALRRRRTTLIRFCDHSEPGTAVTGLSIQCRRRAAGQKRQGVSGEESTVLLMTHNPIGFSLIVTTSAPSGALEDDPYVLRWHSRTRLRQEADSRARWLVSSAGRRYFPRTLLTCLESLTMR